MPPKAAYWVLTNEQFNDIKARINELGILLLEKMRQEGFTKIKSSDDWLGVTIEQRRDNILTLIGLSLYRESPLEFELCLRKWDIKDPQASFIELYNKKYKHIEDMPLILEQELSKIRTALTTA